MNDLGEVLDRTLARLAAAHAEPDSPWRCPALATVSADGCPGVRTIVLRGFDRAARVATLHTDARSPKMAALHRDARAALHIWDAGRREQVRLDGTIGVADRGETDEAWAGLPAGSRATYDVALAPGTPIARPEEAAADPSGSAGRCVFTVLRLQVTALEVLSLTHGSHRRAAFHWRDGLLTATWLVP